MNQGQILVFQHDEIATAWITVQRVVARIPRVGYIVRTQGNNDFIVSGRPPHELSVYYLPD